MKFKLRPSKNFFDIYSIYFDDYKKLYIMRKIKLMTSSKIIFKKIENVRKKNKNWMDLLRLSYESNPKKKQFDFK